MNATFHPPFAAGTASAASKLGVQWAALGDAANVVAALAGLPAEASNPQHRNFPALIRDTEQWRRTLAANGVADLQAIMEPGLAALLAINARGANPAPAARALWEEFAAARKALLGLLPTDDGMGPRPDA